MPNITMMFGVILFLRLGLITASSGFANMAGVIVIAMVFMLITSFAIGNIATTMPMGSGGVYFLISRTLGIELGGAVGISLYLTQIFTIALTISGFALMAHEATPSISVLAYELGALITLTVLSIYSTKLALNAQVVIMIAIFTGITSFLMGDSSHMISTSTPTEPFFGNLDFWATFAMFYPALTGIEAGMALSGNLRNPAKSLINGNFISIILVGSIYIGLSYFAINNIPYEQLISDPFSFVEFAANNTIIYIGIFTATLSSALGALIGAPRMLQSMAEEAVLPNFLSRTFGKYQEPRYALATTLLIALVVLLTTKIDQIIPILSMICLASYSLLNLISAIGGYINAVNWQPSFKVHYSIPSIGFITGVVLMFMINPGWSFITIVIIIGLYVYTYARDIEADFSDIRENILFYLSRQLLYRLAETQDHKTNTSWHPIILALSKLPSQHPNFVWFMHHLARLNGILVLSSIVPQEAVTSDRLISTRQALDSYLKMRKIKGIVELQVADSPHQGYLNMINTYGMGAIQPNTIALNITDINDINDELLEICRCCSLNRKNLMLYSDLPPERLKKLRAASKKKPMQIDMLWDSDAKDSRNLMLTIGLILHDSKTWRHLEINLKSVVYSESAKNDMTEFLEQHQSMIPTINNTDAMISDGEMGLTKAIYNKSKAANLILIPLRSFDDFDCERAFLDYLRDLYQHCPTTSAKMMMMSFENTEYTHINPVGK